MKVKTNPGSALFPCPVSLITCVGSDSLPNIITLAWVGVVCSQPPTLGIGVRPSRHSHQLIEESGEFVVNIPDENILNETDYCGRVSGRDVDKFAETKLTAIPAEKVKAPLIKECPVNIECVVKQKISLGSHHLFLGEVVRVHVNQDILNTEEKIDFTKVKPIVYNRGEYWSLAQKIGVHGFSKQR